MLEKQEKVEETKIYHGCCCFKNIFTVSSNTRIKGPGFRNESEVKRERKRQSATFPGTVHPYSDFRWWWDILMTIALMGALIFQPLQLAFYSSQTEAESGIIAISSSIVTLIFFLDIIFNFRTGFEGHSSDLVVLDKGAIARKYLTSWFVIDVLSSIPFDALYYLIITLSPGSFGEGHLAFYRAVRLLGLLKVFRLFRVIQCLTRFEKAFCLPGLRIRLINLLVMILTILHWLACWHYLVADLFNPPGHRKEKSWISRAHLWDEPNWIKYINSALRALSNMGCLGYGGFAGEAPSVPEDIIATIISIMIGATCFALYIGTMGGIVGSMHLSEKMFGQRIHEVQEYMKFRNIPNNLQTRVHTYLEQRYRRNYFDEGAILSDLSDVLRNEVQVYNCHHLVERVQLFNSLPNSFLKKMVNKLKFEVYLPGDIIITAGSEGEAMYFIQQGDVDIVTSTGELVSTLSSGDYFGEVALVTDRKTTADVIAKNYCDIYKLERGDFASIFERHPETLEEIKRVAERRNEDRIKKISNTTNPDIKLLVESNHNKY